MRFVAARRVSRAAAAVAGGSGRRASPAALRVGVLGLGVIGGATSRAPGAGFAVRGPRGARVRSGRALLPATRLPRPSSSGDLRHLRGSPHAATADGPPRPPRARALADGAHVVNVGAQRARRHDLVAIDEPAGSPARRSTSSRGAAAASHRSGGIPRSPSRRTSSGIRPAPTVAQIAEQIRGRSCAASRSTAWSTGRGY